MFQYRWRRLGAILLFTLRVAAAPRLTTIQDVLYRADGTPFNGLVVISWSSFDASDSSNIPAQTLRLPVINGFFRVQLVPTTDAVTPVTYAVKYNSDGKIQFTETWAVPPTGAILRVKDVRTAPGTVVTPPAVVSSVQISDVAGLQSELNIRAVIGTGFSSSRAAIINASGALEGAVGNLTDCVRVDGTSAPCASSGGVSGGPAVFVDSEVPSGTLNGVNAAFLLANPPNPPGSLALYRNGLLVRQNVDYAIAGSAIVFQSAARPQPGDTLQASYRLGAVPGAGFVDGETPSGTVDGSNALFAAAQAPSPAASLAVYRNGIRLKLNLDYSLAGKTITFAAGAIPQPGDALVCFYRLALP